MVRIGVILTHDNAIDPELQQWCPPDVTVHIARTGYIEDEDCLAWSRRAADQDLEVAVRSLAFLRPGVTAYACTSGSFVDGVAGERRVRERMLAAGARDAITASGAVVEALEALGARRVAVGTPYDDGCTAALGAFLAEAGFDVVSLVGEAPRPGSDINDYTPEDLTDLARRAAHPDADAVFLSCTALSTIELLPLLERELGRPVLSSVQATMWAALRAVGRTPAPRGQRLLGLRGGTRLPAG